MLDFHSHILPKMDDGSKSVEMSVEMLRDSARQGVDTLILTPHFYADAESPSHFLSRRQHAWDKLSPALPEDAPKLLFGAEVLYFPGISHSSEVASLAIEGTSLILIELPFAPWNEKVFDELRAFESMTGLHVVLAHVERYRPIQKRAIYNQLFEQPFLFQCNASAFLSLRDRQLALRLLDRHMLHFLGSDCHNPTTRPQRMGEARGMVLKKRGEDAWLDFEHSARERFDSYRI